MFFPRYADIETVSHCNARCVYCPQSISPKSANTMDMFLFETILKKIRHEYNIPSDFNVVLNHYGEPLLDKHFLESTLKFKKHNKILHFNLIKTPTTAS